MMRVAIYTLTRDRLGYTKRSFASLAENAGHPYDHYVIDNGSEDGTVEWLKENESTFKKVVYNEENHGISKASNQALKELLPGDYDLIIKMDNDCLVTTKNILKTIVGVYEGRGKFAGEYVLSPYVKGINSQPTRGGQVGLSLHEIGLTSVVGGLFHIVPRRIYAEYQYPENLPKAKGQDETFCHWVKQNGGIVGYIEDLVVEHMDGTDNQAKEYPSYFERKWQEEKP